METDMFGTGHFLQEKFIFTAARIGEGVRFELTVNHVALRDANIQSQGNSSDGTFILMVKDSGASPGLQSVFSGGEWANGNQSPWGGLDFDKGSIEVGSTRVDNTWSFELTFADTGNWESFVELLSDPQYFAVAWNFTNVGPTGINYHFITGTSAVVPEPATLAVLGLGLAGLGYVRTRKVRR